jgi:hypothetical protein
VAYTCRTTCRTSDSRFHGVEYDTAGDGFSASFDVPARAIRCAQAIVLALAPIGVQVRVGVHVGECEVHDGKPAGLAVATGAHICAVGGPGDVLVSSAVRDLLAGTGIALADRSKSHAQGDPWRAVRVRHCGAGARRAPRDGRLPPHRPADRLEVLQARARPDGAIEPSRGGEASLRVVGGVPVAGTTRPRELRISVIRP